MRILKPFLTLAVMVGIVYAVYAFVVFPFFPKYVQVIHLIDGDTLLVKDGKKIEQVQLIGVDAPEHTGPYGWHQCFDDQSKHLVATDFFLQNQDIRLVKDDALNDKDSGGRLLRYIFQKNGDFLNEKILQDGLAMQFTDPQKKYQYQDRFADAQKQAQQQHLGIWDPQGCNGKF